MKNSALTEEDVMLAEDYADNAFTDDLVAAVNDPKELDRLNAHRSENRSQENLNLILQLAIGIRAIPNRPPVEKRTL